ncbi:MAG: PEGA domain-containing protein, partial [Desulfocapsaceae bacterium]
MSRFITIRQVDGSEKQYSDGDLPLTIGSAPGNHIQLPGGDQQAAYIDDAQGHLFIQPAENLTVPLLHNDRQLLESAWLKSKDRVWCKSFVIHYERSGDRIHFSVAEEHDAESPVLTPPLDPPPETVLQGDAAEELPVDIGRTGGTSGKKKMAIAVFALMFLVLSCAVLFVLLARPFELVVSPEPDSVAVSGFLPVVKIGGRYLLLPVDYSVAIQKKGYKDFSTELRGEQREAGSLQVKLEELPGLLNLQLTPPDGVEIYSGDRLLATTPPNTIRIAPGPHNLTLKKERYRPYTTEIIIEGREIVRDVEVSLEPDWADITINSKPEGAEVVIDGTAAGPAPLTLGLLSGTHEIELNLVSYTSSSRPITVQAGIEAEYVFEMTPLPGQLSLTSRPDGAVVSLGNDYMGITPLSLSLPSRTVQEIRLSRPGYQSVSRSLTLAPGEERKLQLELEQEQGVVFLTITPPDASVT